MEKINMMKWVDDAIAAEKKQGFLVLSFPENGNQCQGTGAVQ